MTLSKILCVAICVIVSLVLLAIGTRYIRPHWIFGAVYSLHLHFAVASTLALLVAFLLYRNLAVAALVVLALAMTTHAVVMARQFSSPVGPEDAAAPSFKLLSFNIMSHNYDNGEAIAAMIVASGADIVNLMEAEPLLPHLDTLSRAYPYRIGCGVMADHCDQLMLSKTPLLDASVRDLSPVFGNRFILAETELAGRMVTIAGIHTTKPYFDDFQTFELRRAAGMLMRTDHPLVVAGDFNASSLAPNMRAFLTRTQLRTATAEPPTWPIRLGILGLAIDHVYARSPTKVRSLTRLPDSYGSNHAALLADIIITGN